MRKDVDQLHGDSVHKSWLKLSSSDLTINGRKMLLYLAS